ncbi:exopolyphosphatase [Neosynechococcus sphagnicola]|uniref:exopolyphosphatase n=1 Tax=Neosynechococcus sphagnicola TaxID=1501145 RepID=UPI000AF99E99|nr:exopolyphosphatase [Neosynechococcus sphagnicola]
MSLHPNQYRLVTRSDFDGLVCAVLLRELNLINEIKFAHPKDMQDGKIEITSHDITANLPYVSGAHLVFDHHMSEIIRHEDIYHKEGHVFDASAPSTARLIYDHFGGSTRFPQISEVMMAAVDKSDSAQLSIEEVLEPKGWILLSFIMDSRTGLGRFKDFRISNYDLMMDLVEYCRTYTIDEILQLPDVKERVDLYFEHEHSFKTQIVHCSQVYDPLVVLDLRHEQPIYPGNRFMIYAMYPHCNISIYALPGLNQKIPCLPLVNQFSTAPRRCLLEN